LQRLSVDYVDLLLIHWPTPDMNLEACLEAMFQLKEEGKIKNVGVSNFSASLYEKALQFGRVVNNQVKFSPYQDQKENLDVAHKYKTTITAYSPLERGGIASDKTLSGIAENYNKTPAQITLRWLIQRGNVSVIPKASSQKHRKENIEIFDFELTQEEMDAIRKLNR
jgi:diketogulonate reductase-like aldo/keto reductase